MNPWQSLRREIDGAVRSIRYDLSAKQAKRAMRRDTILLPTIGQRPAKDRRRLYTAAAAVLLPVAGASAYFAVTSGLDALFPGEGAPNGLPAGTPGHRAPSPSPSPATAAELLPVGGDRGRGRPVPRSSPVDPTFTAPVPTPAPSCLCTTPPPPPSPTPSPTTSPSPTPTAEPMPTPAPTRSAWEGGSLSPRPTSRLRP